MGTQGSGLIAAAIVALILIAAFGALHPGGAGEAIGQLFAGIVRGYETARAAQ